MLEIYFIIQILMVRVKKNKARLLKEYWPGIVLCLHKKFFIAIKEVFPK